jgi:peptide/nickel transport system substrate-binding protein
MVKKLNPLLGAVAAALLHLLNPSPALAQTPKDTLVIGMSQYPPSLHPGIEPTVAKVYAMRFGYRPIATYNDDMKMQCFICTELPSIANGRAKVVDLGGGKKGMTVKFTLHPQAKWGDGVAITSKDVAFSGVGSKPESGFAGGVFRRVTKVEVLDPKTCALEQAGLQLCRPERSGADDLAPGRTRCQSAQEPGRLWQKHRLQPRAHPGGLV